jgi:hypothetical protein
MNLGLRIERDPAGRRSTVIWMIVRGSARPLDGGKRALEQARAMSTRVGRPGSAIGLAHSARRVRDAQRVPCPGRGFNFAWRQLHRHGDLLGVLRGPDALLSARRVRHSRCPPYAASCTAGVNGHAAFAAPVRVFVQLFLVDRWSRDACARSRMRTSRSHWRTFLPFTVSRYPGATGQNDAAMLLAPASGDIGMLAHPSHQRGRPRWKCFWSGQSRSDANGRGLEVTEWASERTGRARGPYVIA